MEQNCGTILKKPFRKFYGLKECCERIEKYKKLI